MKRRELFISCSSRAMKFLLAVPLAAGCQGGREGTVKLHEDPVVVRDSIKKLILAGSDIAQAEKIMERNSFTCSRMKNSAFMDKDNLYRNIDFIYCDRSSGFIVSRRWQVAIVHKNGKVQEVYVSTGLIGP